MSEGAVRVGARVRWRDRNSMEALATLDSTLTVVEQHPWMPAMWKVRASDGYETWAHSSWVWVLR